MLNRWLNDFVASTRVGKNKNKNVECTALVRSSVLGLAPRGVQGMYGHFTAVAQLLSPRGAGPTFGEGDLSDF